MIRVHLWATLVCQCLLTKTISIIYFTLRSLPLPYQHASSIVQCSLCPNSTTILDAYTDSISHSRDHKACMEANNNV